MDLNLKKKNAANVFEEVVSEGVPYLRFTALKRTGLVTDGFTTRYGGVSIGDCKSMNISTTRGDTKEAVLENINRLGKALGIDGKKFTYTDQQHTTNVAVVQKGDVGKVFSNTDGMVTNVPEIPLVTFYADCVPLYFLDPIKKAIGLSHSGWKGTVCHMGAQTVKVMEKAYQTRPEDLIACIGPSICQDCYEVSEDVIEEFKAAFPPESYNELFYLKENGKYQLNLWRANELILVNAGIRQENIYTTNICTCCNSDALFSHRGSKGKRGNLSAILMLK
ncbi:peptidoglycan editing factor PgeF [Aequitasia blattaphilus]|uniref:Purine nucleoside phosphorylase n=1 Tax=Aequitasia blattaphilus TaxID=2949332 RepID=A0ABT1E700_9FIRM|nr:peptidoglycan editing factor PgeF [Aequitasia blattaphilus]MCP1101610.1 peptidoglycan editing factor PgeF [Aequitasia blattaphilus]MCR8614250.1 peptidoglycan editing factor PgeF [Aequitasia blattaphilus]